MKTTKQGMVYLAGAGPGDPELVTEKVRRLLGICDTVVYDNLIPDELIVTLPSGVETFYVGKRAGKVCRNQAEINELLVKLAREGKTVVRLKGSDPLIFGRGGEEAKHLQRAGVKFEIVPGITSGVAAAAYAGIPCTDRNIASTVLFVTGHKAKEKETASVDWSWVARARRTTVVIYMGVSEIPNIVAQLVEHGMAKNIPAAAIERGTFPSQKAVVGTLSELPVMVEKNRIKGPAVFIVGDVVSLQEHLAWFKDKSLLGVRVMVTRPADQAGGMYEELRDLGAEVLPYATIATEAYVDNRAWDEFGRAARPHRWLVFTSENGVRYFVSQLLQREYDIRALTGFRIGVIGAGTERALKKHGLQPDFVPSRATTAAFAEEFKSQGELSNATVVRVRGNLSTTNIDEAVTQAGGELLPMTVYETHFTKWPGDLKAKLLEIPPDVVIFTSGTTVDGLFANLSREEIDRVIKSALLVSIGPSTSEVIRSYGLEVGLEAGRHTIPDVIRELEAYAETHSLRRGI